MSVSTFPGDGSDEDPTMEFKQDASPIALVYLE